MIFIDSGPGLINIGLGRGTLHRKRETSETFNSHVSCVMDWKYTGTPNIYPAFPQGHLLNSGMVQDIARLSLIGRVKSPHILPAHTKQTLPRKRSLPQLYRQSSPWNHLPYFWSCVSRRLKNWVWNFSKAELKLQGWGDRHLLGSLPKAQRTHNQGTEWNHKWNESY